MALDAAVGMEYLHSIDMIHRDLKSLNLLVHLSLSLSVQLLLCAVL
jgi:serine/threonine protein kinase